MESDSPHRRLAASLRQPLAAPLDITSLTELLCLYRDADEMIFMRYCQLDEQEIADLCWEARHLAHHLRRHYGARSAVEIACAFGVEVERAQWQVAEGRGHCFAECRLRPPKITLNLAAISQLASRFAAVSQRLSDWPSEDERAWFAESRIIEAITAHELYGIFQQRPSPPAAELAAYAFAREFTGLPFSPLLYGALLMLPPPPSPER
jgi:hypothetical protein